jgi:hypothetical protein
MRLITSIPENTPQIKRAYTKREKIIAIAPEIEPRVSNDFVFVVPFGKLREFMETMR